MYNTKHLIYGRPLPWDGFGNNPLEDYPNIGMIWYTGYYPRPDGSEEAREFVKFHGEFRPVLGRSGSMVMIAS